MKARRTPKPATLAATHSFQTPGEKSPRQWAAEIYMLPTRETRKAALEAVPDEFKAMVRKHVELWFVRRKDG